MFAQGGVFILSFVLVWVFANLLSPEVYGQYRFLVTIVSILALTSLPGMTTAIIRAVARGHSGTIPHAVHTRVRYGLLGSLGAVIGASYYFWQGNAELGYLFILIAVFVPLYQSFAVATHYHNGRKDFKNYTTIAVIRRAIIVLATIAAIILSQNIFIILGTYLISTALVNYWFYRRAIRRFPVSDSVDPDAVHYGKQLSIMSAAGAIANHFDKIALWYLAGPIQVAVYTIVVSLPRELASAFGNIGILALPKMAARSITELRESLLRKIFVYFLAVLPVALLYVVVAPYIFAIFLPQYVEYVQYSQLAAGVVLLTPVALLMQYMQATMHTRALYALQFVLPVIAIALYAGLIPWLGILGAVLALLGKKASGFFLLLWYFVTDTRTEATGVAQSAQRANQPAAAEQ